jgi:hypothetical protein
MRCFFWIVLFSLLLAVSALHAQAAPDGTPERAIQDMLLASKPEEIEKHLPVSTLAAIKTLDPEDRREREASLLLGPRRLEEKTRLEIPDDGHAFAVMQLTDTQQLEAQLTDSITTGAEAVLRFTLRWPLSRSAEVLVWMRFEDGEWRIRELSPGAFGGRILFDRPDFVERFRNRQQKQNESEAISTLYTLSYALQRYADFRPDVGYPDDISVLVQVGADSDDEQISFLGADLAQSDFVRSGYRYRYQLIRGGPQGAYRITARPVDLPKSGRYAYFTDEAGEVHQTSEDRDATGDDPLLNSQENRE